MTLVASSCTDVLDQMPTTEDTSKDVYAEAANYKRVLAKIYASYVLAGQGQGGDNGDLTSINKQDFSRGYFNLQEAATDEVANTWLSGNNLSDLTYISWDAKDSWVSDSYYWLFFNIALCFFAIVRMKRLPGFQKPNKLRSVLSVRKLVL